MYDNTEHSEKELVAVGENSVTLPKELNLDMALHGFSGKKLLTLDAVYSDHHEEIVYTRHSKASPHYCIPSVGIHIVLGF